MGLCTLALRWYVIWLQQELKAGAVGSGAVLRVNWCCYMSLDVSCDAWDTAIAKPVYQLCQPVVLVALYQVVSYESFFNKTGIDLIGR